MPGTTAKGFPYSLGGDGANTIDDSMGALAAYIDDWFSPKTTAQRDLLTISQKPDGRVIYNSTTKRLERWDATTVTWRAVSGDPGLALIFSVL